jgi:hypothetical protein
MTKGFTKRQLSRLESFALGLTKKIGVLSPSTLPQRGSNEGRQGRVRERGSARSGLVLGLAMLVIGALAAGVAPTINDVASAAIPMYDLAQAKNHDDTVIPIILWALGWEVAAAAGALFLITSFSLGGGQKTCATNPDQPICSVKVHPKAPINWREHLIPFVLTGYEIKESGQIHYH